MENKKTLDEEKYPIRAIDGNFNMGFTFSQIIEFIGIAESWDYEVMYENEVIPAAEFIIKETILRYFDANPRTLNGYASRSPTLLTKKEYGTSNEIVDFFYNNQLHIREEGILPEIYADKDSVNVTYPIELKNIIEAFEEVPQLSELPPFPVKYRMYISMINITPKLFPATHKFLISDLQDPRERQILKKRFSITSKKDINNCITNMEKNNSSIGGEIHASPDFPYAHPIEPMPPKTFREIAEAQINLYESKNADYGDAADKLFESYGLNYYLIMLEQKLLRIKNLNEKQDKANNESIEDSLLDMSNYAILAVESLRKKKE